MGEHLSDAFRLSSTQGRGQSSLSASGSAWHSLLTFYLNVVYAGSDAVAVTRSTAPRAVHSAMKVSYGGTSVEGDLDVALVVLPGAGRRGDVPGATAEKKRLSAKKAYWDLFDAGFNTAYVCLVACKTNWNDTIQNPMLWNFVYSIRAGGGPLPGGLTIGANGFSLDQLTNFTNAFVTVPTNAVDKFKSTGMPVQRARTMTGGYYWGYPSRGGICMNIREFLDVQASKSKLVPPAANGGAAFLRELQVPTDSVDVDAFDW
jgi:hypothetical protein